ncbi:molybdopterin oxidoreductase family protein [Candidatus Entotheonella palauensis]|uniref:Dehydrogenase n=1 Tax=Candidatus Entotheonella gemina TaxID=1429439 RepID=W4M9Y0_9BACT|nr:molybdopterin oxidoreductase family protein [Candidatus Entotheonella palauensis]ETX06985.1 MAG: dehydrogenase [Candidatus Entotheonella gemina]
MAEWIKSACPHDCPSACALEVERLSPHRIGRVRGAKQFDYTAGIVCAKVGRYAERIHHPERLRHPLKRVGEKGAGDFTAVSWDDALDEVANAFIRAAQHNGSEAVWPYHSGGTMGIVQRWGIERLRHVMRYSRQKTTICVTPAESGWRAGVGRLEGVDPREMAESDLIVVWGGNPVSTQVNVMNHIQRARRHRGAKLVVIDCYRTPSVEAADIGIVVRPGTDAALACAMMGVMLREGMADRDYLAHYTDFDHEVECHLAQRTPSWAAGLTGLSEETIIDLARLYGSTQRAFLRLGFGFTRSRNGSANMHAVSALPAVSGAWRYPGGGAFFLNLDNWRLDTTLAHGLDVVDDSIRLLDQSRIGPILCSDRDALSGGPPVTAMLMQNANSANVAPDSHAVRRGLTRDDLFLCVHEQFMTATAQCADIVLPASMFLEHDDIYYGLGHTAITVGRRVLDRYGECWSNHEVLCALAKRLGAEHPGFEMSAWKLVDATLQASGLGTAAEAAERGYVERGSSFREGHFLNGFPNETGRFRFKPDWTSIGPYGAGMPPLPDFFDAIEKASETHPFRLVAPPARTFLNTSFTETPGSRKREQRPTVLLHPDDADQLGIQDGDVVRLGNSRGEVVLAMRRFDGVHSGTLIAEGIWPNRDFRDGLGINHLIGADPVPPAGGVAFHDTAVWLHPV